MLVMLVLLALGACEDAQRVPPGERLVELARSGRVELTIRNDSGRELQVVSSGGGVALTAGGAMQVPLVVTKIAKLSDMVVGGPAGVLSAPASAAFYTISSEAGDLVEMQGPRGVVRVRAGIETWMFFLEADDCVFCGPHAPVLHVVRRPGLAQPPLDLCEP